MGQTLSEPLTEKETSQGGDNRFMYGASSMQGWRIRMEDAHTTLLKIDPDSEIAFFAVFDGHGGKNAAIFAGDELHKHILATESFSEGNYEQAIKKGFLNADETFRKKNVFKRESSGCTAVCVLITPDGTIYCGNAGDSRCILSTSGANKELSFDHKPNNQDEYRRIIEGGGFVEFNRVNGNLALSRALGDFDFKKNSNLTPEKQVVTAYPDVIQHSLQEGDEFLVLACDGIWDCMSNQQVISYISCSIARGLKLPEICENLMMDCLAKDTGLGGIGCDNMTVVIVAILGGKTSDEWYQSVKQRYEAGVGSSEHGSFSEASLNPSESEPSNEVSGELPKKTLPQKSENTPTQILDTTPSGDSEIAMGNATKDLPKDILDAAPMDGTVDSAPTPTSDTALSSDASEPTDLSIPESKKLD